MQTALFLFCRREQSIIRLKLTSSTFFLLSLTDAKSSGNKKTIQNGKNQPMVQTTVTYHGWDLMLPNLDNVNTTRIKSNVVAIIKGAQSLL